MINADENEHHGQQSQKQKSHWAVGRWHSCGDAEATSSNDLQNKTRKNIWNLLV